MENSEKFASSKDVIAFLAETFPNCFSIEGEAKPLKIGIFQDLAERLAEEPRVSKTLLRTSLRHYTNSWRYLYSIKPGAARVDLDGNNGEVIEDEHAQHAQQKLSESKQRVADKRKAEGKGPMPGKKRPNNKAKSADNTTMNGKPSSRGRTIKKGPPPAKLTETDLKAGTAVTVKVGKAPMQATITEVAKDGVHVQLVSGMVLKVKADSLRLAPTKR